MVKYLSIVYGQDKNLTQPLFVIGDQLMTISED